MPKPPTIVDLTWNGHLEFAAHAGHNDFILDSAGIAGLSPVDALAAALAGCMAMDLAHILTKGRHVFTALQARLVAERADDDPHRLVSVTLHFDLAGAVPREPIERAIALSRDTYCSVWQSLRQDIRFQVTFDVTP